MSKLEPTKVISIRLPAIYFHRLGYLAYHQGKLPSDQAREILKEYLDLGCIMCGGPVIKIDYEEPMAFCVNSDCGPLDSPILASNYKDDMNKSRLPGFSNRLTADTDQDFDGPT